MVSRDNVLRNIIFQFSTDLDDATRSLLSEPNWIRLDAMWRSCGLQYGLQDVHRSYRWVGLLSTKWRLVDFNIPSFSSLSA